MFIQISWSRIGKPYNYAEFLCETDSDVAALPTQKGKCAVGSKAFVLSSSKTYILNNNMELVMNKTEDMLLDFSLSEDGILSVVI